MKLRQLFENIYDVNEGGEEFDNSLKTIGVCFGRWNPPHKGHKAVWQNAATNPIWYVGTNQSTAGPKDPLPYDVKLQCMQAVWPKVAGHVIPEQSLLTLASRIYSEHGENVHLKVYTDEEWLYKALSQYNGVEKEHGMYKFIQIDWVKTERLASATNLRAAVRNDDRKSFYHDMGIKPSVTVAINGKHLPVFDVVAHFLNKYPEKVKKAVAEDCWKGYKQIGMKKKGGKQVPNCVPNESKVDEGDVVKFPKKHRGDSIDEIAGAFPTPSHQAAMYKAAADSNAAEAKRQEQLKVQQLQKNTAEVDRQQKINHHSLDGQAVTPPTNESYMSELDSEIGDHLEKKLEMFKANRINAEVLGEYCIKLSHLLAKKHKLELHWIQDAINNYVEDALSDTQLQEGKGGMKKISPEQKAAMKNASTLPGLNMSTGSGGAYMNYRMGIALAAAPNFPVGGEADNWIGGDPLISSYTKEEFDMVKAAAKQVGAGTIQNWSGDRSKEVADVQKISPVAKPKRNKYGI